MIGHHKDTTFIAIHQISNELYFVELTLIMLFRLVIVLLH